jgi:hypothetical protein
MIGFVVMGRLGLLTAGMLATAACLTSAALGAAARAPAPAACPTSAVVTAKLGHKIVKLSSSIAHFSDGQGVDGARRTCNYTTSDGANVMVQLSTGAQVLAFVDAEDAATDLPTGYQNHSHVTEQIVPVFGLGNDAWALKPAPGQPTVLSALYHSRAIVIAAPKTSIGKLAALAKATLGVPTPDQKNV